MPANTEIIKKGAHKAGPGRAFFDVPNLSGLAEGPAMPKPAAESSRAPVSSAA